MQEAFFIVADTFSEKKKRVRGILPRTRFAKLNALAR